MTRALFLLSVSIVLTAGLLGLAILGAGGPARFFAHPALIALALATLGLAIAGLLTKGNLSTGDKEDRSNRWVLPVFFILMLAGAYLPAYTDRVGFWTLGGEGLRWFGVALYAGGGAFRLWPVLVLGRRFSGLVAIQPGHELVTDGIFALIRNPSYVGLVVNALGWGLAFRSGVGVVIAALYVPPLIARIHAEEAFLRAHFGAAYDAYCARTSRLVPGLY